MKPMLVLPALLLQSCVLAAPHTPAIVNFETEDSVKIVADYYKPQAANSPVAILLHMHRSKRSAWEPLVPHLREAGFAVLAIDMRGHGESVTPAAMNLERRSMDRDPTLYNAMYHDVAAAYAFLARQGDVDLTRLAVVGASVGCSVAIDYGRRERSVDVVICMTPGENYLGVDSVDHIKAYGAKPILLLATEDVRRAAEALGTVNTGATVDIVGGGRVHGTHMFGRIDGIEGRIVSFVRENIGVTDAERSKPKP